MKTQIDNAFADLNKRLIDGDQKWAISKLDTVEDFLEKSRVNHVKGGPFDSGFGGFCRHAAKKSHFGSKSMTELLCGHGREVALDNMRKNTMAIIAKRDATIIKAMNNAGITEIPEFTLAECSDGIEGSFNVAGHVVTIRTILAGGYNVQRLHMRTLVKVR